MDKNRKRTPTADAAEIIVKEVAVAAISKKVPAMKPIARPLVNMAFRKGKQPPKKCRKI